MKKLGNSLIHLMEDLSEVSTNGKAEVKINKNLCNPEEFKQLFNYFTRGTILERIDLKVKEMETEIQCVCGYTEAVEEIDHNGYDNCPECGRIADIDDSGYQIVDPNPEKTKVRNSIKF